MKKIAHEMVRNDNSHGTCFHVELDDRELELMQDILARRESSLRFRMHLVGWVMPGQKPHYDVAQAIIKRCKAELEYIAVIRGKL